LESEKKGLPDEGADANGRDCRHKTARVVENGKGEGRLKHYRHVWLGVVAKRASGELSRKPQREAASFEAEFKPHVQLEAFQIRKKWNSKYGGKRRGK